MIDKNIESPMIIYSKKKMEMPVLMQINVSYFPMKRWNSLVKLDLMQISI